jgi:hypothetical protein
VLLSTSEYLLLLLPGVSEETPSSRVVNSSLRDSWLLPETAGLLSGVPLTSEVGLRLSSAFWPVLTLVLSPVFWPVLTLVLSPVFWPVLTLVPSPVASGLRLLSLPVTCDCSRVTVPGERLVSLTDS